jgi:cellulose synthase/poly-beta-1,6-N-acetylglucosamine synthase-like glycosyltransferase
MTHMIFLAACAIGAVVVCLPLFILLGASRRGSGITYNDKYQPRVAIITPMYNEGFSIRRTIESLLRQDYPAHLREIIVVDDCSTDDSFLHASQALAGVANARVVRNPHNMGKRRSINRAIGMTTAEIVVSVDSDVVVEDTAVKRMIRCFSSSKVAAVGGRVAILNERENWLSRMQAVKYYYSYFLMKRVELRFRSVMCLSGCLTAYRRTVLQELLPVLENRSVMGIEIKYGEDRFLTRMIVKAGYETIMNPQAVCRTVAPTSLSVYLSQQLRWRRSNMVDYLGGLSHVWKGHPLVAFYFFSLFVAILLYPALLVSALASGTFLTLMTYQLIIAFILGVAYRLHAYKDPDASAWNAIPLAFLFPLTYGILTPVALLTLDAGSWETRTPEAVPAAAANPMLVPVKVNVNLNPVPVKLSPANLIAVASRLGFQTDTNVALGLERSNDK